MTMKQNAFIKNIQSNKLYLFFLFFVSCIYVTAFSWSTSPCFKLNLLDESHNAIFDSTVFQSMGRFVSQGLLPYKDCFDHKGPMNIFIQQLGYSLHPLWGIFLLQIFNLFLVSFGIFMIFKLFLSSRKSFFFTLFILGFLSFGFLGGNYTEEWCLAPLIWSFYLIMKYFANYDQNHLSHSTLYSFFYGISFAFCTFMRITNALPLCCMILVGIYLLIKNKLWKNIFLNACSFLFGAFTLTLPLILWFWKKRILNDMLYATFIYNIKYSAQNSDHTIDIIYNPVILFIIPLLLSFIISTTCFFIIKDKRYAIISGGTIFMSTIALFFQLHSRPFYHYFVIWIPMTVLTLILLNQLFLVAKKWNRIAVDAFLVFFSFMILTHFSISIFKTMINYIYADQHLYISCEKEIVTNNIDDQDLNKVLCYNIHPRIYLDTDILPCYKNFVLQDFQCQYDPDLYDRFYSDLKSLDAKYIIVNLNKPTLFDNYIYKHYTVKDSNHFFILLERN